MENLSNNKNYILKDLERDIENVYIRKVATISANNDTEIGTMVSDLFTSRDSNHVFVTTELGTTDDTFVDKEVGFEFGAGFINPIMANQVDRITCKLKNPKFFLVDGPLTLNDMSTLHMVIDHVLIDLKQPIVLIAKDYDQPVLNMLVERCTRSAQMKNNTPIIHEKELIAALTINSEHEKSKDRLEDLRILLGCEIVETKKGKLMNFKNNADFINSFLGEADEFSGTQLSTRIKRGQGDKAAVLERINHIENRIKDIDRNEGILAFSTIDGLKRRIAMMNSDMTIIKVGGANDKERRAKRLIFDDAILSCLSAINSGFTLGGNVSISHYIHNNTGELISEVTDKLINGSRHIIVGNKPEDISKIVSDILLFIEDAFKSAYEIVVSNMVGVNTKAYNDIMKIVYDDTTSEKPRVFDLVRGKISSLNDDDSSVIVPANTDFELMRSIFGSVGTLVSSNQFLKVYPGDSVVYRTQK